MPAPEVRVGIVSWNTAELLDGCLAALPAALGGLAAEVVVVDNDSSDGSAAVAERHGVRVVRHPTNAGYPRAMDLALAGTDAPVLIALNPDTRPGPGSLERLVARLRATPRAGIVVPRLVGLDGRPQHSAYALPGVVPPLAAAVASSRMREGAVGRRLLLEGSGPHPDGPVPWALGAVHVIRAAALEGRAPYVERSFMYAEDLELCWWLGQRGWTTVLDAGVEVPHAGNAAGAQAFGDDRSLRYWAATYDVVALRRSTGRARVVAAAGVAAILLAILRALPAALARRGPHRDEARGTILLRWREGRLHARAALVGPPAPIEGPPAQRGGTPSR